MADNYVIAFDLLETLLDVSALDDAFREHFGGSQLRQEWFTEVQNLVFAITAANRYESFSDISAAALKVIEERNRPGVPPASSSARGKFLPKWCRGRTWSCRTCTN